VVGARSKEPEILIEHRGGLVLVTLNRPDVLNALSLDMIRKLDEGLRAWQRDPGVHAVLVKGAGERAFCAGGDIRALYETLIHRGVEEAVAYYAVEYPMNARLHHFEKPYIAVLDGITMGGGVGVSIHGSYRIVTERTMFAMPETGIGLFPDVGGTHFLPRLPGALGLYLGLTGARIGAADCLHAGVGTHHISPDRLAGLEDALARADLSADTFAAVEGVLDDFRSDAGEANLAGLAPRIDDCFGRPDLAAVFDRLSEEPSGWGPEQLRVLESKSPTSLAVTFRQLQEGRALDFDDAMRLEYRLVHRFMAGHDFPEGVRALIVDKDNRPKWRPDRRDEVSQAEIDGYFAPLETGELVLDWSG
jgi:enoyl-CoA hydratase